MRNLENSSSWLIDWYITWGFAVFYQYRNLSPEYYPHRNHAHFFQKTSDYINSLINSVYPCWSLDERDDKLFDEHQVENLDRGWGVQKHRSKIKLESKYLYWTYIPTCLLRERVYVWRNALERSNTLYCTFNPTCPLMEHVHWYMCKGMHEKERTHCTVLFMCSYLPINGTCTCVKECMRRNGSSDCADSWMNLTDLSVSLSSNLSLEQWQVLK